MIAPDQMKNKPEVITSIHNAQEHFKEEITAFSSSMTRPLLEALLLTYVTRYKEASVVEVLIDCTACGGDGKYHFTNGNIGSCFRCKGKGTQNVSDVNRNACWDHYNQPSGCEELAPEVVIDDGIPDAAYTDFEEDDRPF